MTNAKIEAPGVPEVYKSMLNILKKLSVQKNGTLPSNMSGKPYITAADVSKETKALFVEEELVILPQESIIEHQIIPRGDRAPNIAISIEGTYTIVSVRDGSQAVIRGAGDGLAAGTAVASNIASTNALKNGLLRTFLITEQSVEDAAKEGVKDSDESNTAASRAVNTAKGSTPKAPATENTGALDEARANVKAAWKQIHGDDDDFQQAGYMKLGEKKFEKNWSSRLGDLKALAKAILDGEVA